MSFISKTETLAISGKHWPHRMRILRTIPLIPVNNLEFS